MSILKKKKLNCGLIYQFLGIKIFLLKKRKLENVIQCMKDEISQIHGQINSSFKDLFLYKSYIEKTIDEHISSSKNVSYPIEKNALPICFICNDSYANLVMTTLMSLKINKYPDTIYDIHILGSQVSERNIQRLLFFNSQDMHITYHAVENKYQKNNSSVPYITTFLKFDIVNLLTEYDKVLYLDCDLLVLNDLSCLFKTDLENVYAAVVANYTMDGFDEEPKRLSLPHYFNAGVMLLNLKKMRSDNIFEKLIQTFKKNIAQYKFGEQDVFNCVFNQEIILLDPKYNFLSAAGNDAFVKSKIQEYYHLSDSELDSLCKYPVILHFAGQKVWVHENGYGVDLWNHYFKKMIDFLLGFKK